ncbi:hypothetical protein INT43_002862 [Umbelopsis isabellina]|uniref:BHLH domain-containing protein n=1 Tax=Mortierella isabellina TaxID=91625 RepID=A0A8H7Q799_MORIS|nr:hypothetical protein INT43_002862 [Umbelopsis isabellina]
MNNKSSNAAAHNPPRLTHPTKYHLQMQQQRLARDSGQDLDQQQFVIDPLAFPQHLFFPPQKTSPHLSDMDYADIPDNIYADSPTSTSLVQDDLLYDELSTPPMEMKRSFNPHYPMYIQSPPNDKGFAMSAPANIGGFIGDPYNSMHSTTSSSLKYPQTPTIDEEGDVGSYEDDYTTQANLQAVMEKRRRRRESHNLVERRRRDNINERIQELGLLLPDAILDGANKPNKGQILRKSVEQIKMLQGEVNMYQSKVQELESLLEQYKINRQS